MSKLEEVLAAIDAGQPTSTSSGKGGAALAMSILSEGGGKKKKKKGLFGGNILEDVFNVVSLPLAASTAVAEETVGQGARALGNVVFGAPQDAGFSLERIGRRTIDPESQIHGVDLVTGNAEKGLDVGMFGEQGQYSKWEPPTAAKIAMGFGLDIGLDPLTFLMPAGKVHGAAEAAGHIAESAGLQIGEKLGLPGGKMTPELVQEILSKSKPIDELVKVSPETALEIEEIRNRAQAAVNAARRGGASNLTAQQLEDFGSFTNELGIERNLEKGMKLDFGRLGSIKLTSGEGPVAQLSVLRHKSQMQLGDMLLGTEAKGLTRFGKWNGAPELNALARSGPVERGVSESGLSMMDATVLKRLRSTTRVIADNATKEAQRHVVSAIKGHSTEQINAAHDVIDSGVASADDAVNALAKSLSDVFEKHGRQLVDGGVLREDELLKSGTYFPSPITKDAREALVAAGLHPEGGGVFNNVKGFVEGRRKLWDPTTGEGGVGFDSETTQRIGFKAKTRLEAEQKAAKIVAEKLDEAAKADPEGAAANFLGNHPEALAMLEKGEYPIFMEGREALVAQTRAIGRRVAQARAGRKLFEQGYGMINPQHARGFVDYGPTVDDVSRMLRLGGQASEEALDKAAAAREMKLTANEFAREAKARFGPGGPEEGLGGVSPERPPEGPVSPSTPAAPSGATLDVRGSEAAAEARLAAPATETAEATRAARVAEIEGHLPPQPEGTTRLFNRGNTNWWNEGLTSEAVAGPAEDLRYLDVTAQELRQMRRANTAGATDHGIAIDETINAELTPLMNRAKPVIAEAAPTQSAIDEALASLSQYGAARTPHATPPTGRAERALNSAHEVLTTAQVTQNMNRVEAVIDDVRSFLRDRVLPKRMKPIESEVSDHLDRLSEFARELELQEPSSFGYRDPLEEIPIPGNAPQGTVGTSSRIQKIRALEDLLRKQVKDFEAHPDVYAAKTRARIEGKVAEDAQRAKVGAELPDTTLTPERRRPWTYDETQAHKATYGKVKSLGAERGKALQEVKAAEAEVTRASRTPERIVRQTTERADTRLRIVRDEREQLDAAWQEKRALDEQAAAATAEQRAYERPVGGTEDLAAETGDNLSGIEGETVTTGSGSKLQRWADRNRYPEPEGELTGQELRDYEDQLAAWHERNNMPIEHGEGADYARENAQGMGTRAEGKRQYLQTDKVVDDQIRQRLSALDDEIDYLERTATVSGPNHPVTQLDIAEARLEARRAALENVNGELEEAKRGLPKDRKFSEETVGGTREPTPGSAYEKVLNDMHEVIAEKNARAVEPHLEGRERYTPGDAPFRTQDDVLIKEGTLAGAHTERLPKEIIDARIAVIKERWRTLGATVNDHSQMRDAFAAYKGGLDKAIPQSVERDMQALAHTQVDQVGRLAQDPSHVASVVDDIVADADAVRGVAPSVVPEQVQVNFDKRATESAQWQAMSEQGTNAGEAARAEIAHMRLIADQLANDADMARANASSWLSEWNSITTERRMHTAVNSLLVQGSVDWLAHTALQRGILTPQGVAEALLYVERVATPEGQARFAEAWRKSLHWMRVWQITSPGFHVRNLFGGIFNNALAGVNVESYVRFSGLWRKARAAERGGAELTEMELRQWRAITSAVSPGQISSEGLGNPASRIMGEAALSRHPVGAVLGTHSVLPRASENAGQSVEFYLRGSLIYDTMSKGGSLDDAVAAVNKFHFDYNDSSIEEQKLKANLIPFLTWTRHNVPLQLQMMVQNPRPYARFAHFKRTVESQSEADKVVPGYFADINAVRLPWNKGGGHNYLIPDLPFRDLGLVTEPIQQLVGGEGDLGQRALAGIGEPLSSTTPLASGPIEWVLGKQFYKGLPLRGDRGIKLHDLHIPEWLATPLRMTPLVKKGKNGQSYITERDFYIFEKLLPVLGRARRLGGSSEKKQRDKQMSRLISFFAGTQIRTNTEEDQSIANYISTLETKRQKTINNGLSGP